MVTLPTDQSCDGIAGCYLLCFHRNGIKSHLSHAGHYLGFAEDIGRRLRLHRAGCSGVRFIAAVVAAGHDLKLTRIWPGADRKMERKLKGHRGKKRAGSLARKCPICMAIKKQTVALTKSLSKSTP